MLILKCDLYHLSLHNYVAHCVLYCIPLQMGMGSSVVLVCSTQRTQTPAMDHLLIIQIVRQRWRSVCACVCACMHVCVNVCMCVCACVLFECLYTVLYVIVLR